MSGFPSVPCPECGAPLLVALEDQVEARLTQLLGGFGIGAIRQTAGQMRRRLERKHCTPYGKLAVDRGGKVVFCNSCEFMGRATAKGIKA